MSLSAGDFQADTSDLTRRQSGVWMMTLQSRVAIYYLSDVRLGVATEGAFICLLQQSKEADIKEN